MQKYDEIKKNWKFAEKRLRALARKDKRTEKMSLEKKVNVVGVKIFFLTMFFLKKSKEFLSLFLVLWFSCTSKVVVMCQFRRLFFPFLICHFNFKFFFVKKYVELYIIIFFKLFSCQILSCTKIFFFFYYLFCTYLFEKKKYILSWKSQVEYIFFRMMKKKI